MKFWPCVDSPTVEIVSGKHVRNVNEIPTNCDTLECNAVIRFRIRLQWSHSISNFFLIFLATIEFLNIFFFPPFELSAIVWEILNALKNGIDS